MICIPEILRFVTIWKNTAGTMIGKQCPAAGSSLPGKNGDAPDYNIYSGWMILSVSFYRAGSIFVHLWKLISSRAVWRKISDGNKSEATQRKGLSSIDYRRKGKRNYGGDFTL